MLTCVQVLEGLIKHGLLESIDATTAISLGAAQRMLQVQQQQQRRAEQAREEAAAAGEEDGDDAEAQEEEEEDEEILRELGPGAGKAFGGAPAADSSA